ncbi:MAG: hypothetical protein A2987_06070 [Omnitrophica bacterium RIFCSPLOWO2_01_FULL_45_10]|nr:MAG: hypothetical protein A2987_06070 [Omnitrophica bacterium RIFCSPLOWO2_01_FULL_45_10]
MPLYQYSSKTKDSRTVKGREYAASEHDLLNALAHRSLTVISLAEIKEEKRRPLIPLAKKKIKILDLTILCKQLATMVKGGVPLIRALESIGSETKNVLLKKTLFEMRDYIHAGDSFSGSIKRFPNVFSTLFIAIVEAGEKVGALDIMLERLSTYLAAWERITKKIKMALTYPAIIVSFFTIALTVVSLVLIPKFKDIYAGFGAKLPTITLVIFNISDFLIHNIIFILLVGFAVFSSLSYLVFKTKKGKYIFDKGLLRIPLFGEAIKKAAITRFARTLATLMSEGIPVTEALDLVGKTSGNCIIEEASLKASKLILNGETIPDAFKKTEIFPSLVLQMTQVGVESGNLPELLDKTADFYEDQVDTFVTMLTTMIEPILIILLGVVLGIAIIALYMPIFKLTTAIGMTG